MQNVEKALEKAPGHELASRLRDEWTSSQVTQTDAAVPPAPQREPVADEIPALVEMTRRLETSTEELRAASQQQLDALHQATATAALQAGKLVKLTEQSSAEQKQIDTLTQRIERLIAVMTRLTIVAALVGGMLTISVLVQLYRWWRG